MDYAPIVKGKFIPIREVTKHQISMGEKCPMMEWYKYIGNSNRTVKYMAMYMIRKSRVYKAAGYDIESLLGKPFTKDKTARPYRIIEVSGQIYKIDMNSITPQNAVDFRTLPMWIAIPLSTIHNTKDRQYIAALYLSKVNNTVQSYERKEFFRRLILDADVPKNDLSPSIDKIFFGDAYITERSRIRSRRNADEFDLRPTEYPDDTSKAMAIISKFTSSETKDKIAYCIVNYKNDFEKSLDDIIDQEVKRLNAF